MASKGARSQQLLNSNPLLKKGEERYETDTNKVKRGDGKTKWNDLPYLPGSLLTEAAAVELNDKVADVETANGSLIS